MRALLPLLLLGVCADEDLTTCTNALATVTAMDDECAGAGTFSSCTDDNATYATYTMTQRMMECGLSVPSNVIAEPGTCLGAVQRLIMFYHYCDCDQTCAGSGSCVYNTCSGDCTDNCDLSSSGCGTAECQSAGDAFLDNYADMETGLPLCASDENLNAYSTTLVQNRATENQAYVRSLFRSSQRREPTEHLLHARTGSSLNKDSGSAA